MGWKEKIYSFISNNGTNLLIHYQRSGRHPDGLNSFGIAATL
jgi:hypothetical protein